jgi:hypothetical protein
MLNACRAGSEARQPRFQLASRSLGVLDADRLEEDKKFNRPFFLNRRACPGR